MMSLNCDPSTFSKPVKLSLSIVPDGSGYGRAVREADGHGLRHRNNPAYQCAVAAIHLITNEAADAVITLATDDQVLAEAAEQEVVATPAIEHVVTSDAVKPVVEFTPWK
jgi:hypothetical protein